MFALVPLDINTLIYFTIKNEYQLLNVPKDVVKKMNEIPIKFFTEAADVLACQLSKTINVSVKQSIFSKECKFAKLQPRFKKGSKTRPNFTSACGVQNY